MKILFLLSKIPPVVGGRENSAWNMALELKKKHEVFVITNDLSKNLDNSNKLKINGIYVYFLKDFFKKKKISYLFYPHQAKKYFNLIKPNIIHAHIPGKLSHIFRNYKVSKVLTYGSGSVNLVGAKLKDIINHYRFKSPSINKYNLIVTPGERIKNECVFFKDKNVISIPNGLDINIFNNKSKKNRLPFSCVYVGRMLDYKGVNSIINLSKKLFNYHFTFVGEGPLKNSYKAKNITYIGIVNQAELSKIYQKNTYFVFAGQEENFPNVGLEAMACGCIVIAPKTGFSEYITNKRNGFLLENVNTKSYVDIISNLEKNDEFRSRIVENAVIDAKDYSWNKVINKYEKVYSKLIV